MDLAALVQAVEVLMSPLEWGSLDAWLGECRRRVGEVLGPASRDVAADPAPALEQMLYLPGDEPGWLRSTLGAPEGERWGGTLPHMTTVPDTLLPIVSLRCAIAAGLATLKRLGAWRETLGRAFDELETGMAIYAHDGLEEIARNARLAELLAQEPERDRLRSLIARQAQQAAAGNECLPMEEDREVVLAGGSYRLVASRAAAGMVLPEPAVMVLMDRLSSALPTTQELRISFGLRGREPQIALLAAEGLSNAAIAARLRLSAHTVRHYLERVLDRLGLRTRKALALHLMAPSRRTP